MHNYKEEARAARLRVLEMVYKAGSSHIGSNFSVIDILTVLFANLKQDDQVILSAGWKAAAFYYFLAKQGHFPESELGTYNAEGSRLIGLTEPGVPGVLFAGGSMQMGLPAAVGFALAKKIKGQSGRVYCILSDGELAGGMIWESALIAVNHQLDNLCIIIDDNKLQAMGEVKDILGGEHGNPRFPVVGFYRREIDGHDYKQVEEAFIYEDGWAFDPVVITAHTIKGKDVGFMENDNRWHYQDLCESDYNMAKRELESL